MKLKPALLLFLVIAFLLAVFLLKDTKRVSKSALRLRAEELSQVLIEKANKKLRLAEFIGGKTPIQIGGKTAETLGSFGRTIIPTVLGSSNYFTGAATFTLPFIIPSGPGGFTPQLGIAYSSQSLDDARAGNELWQESYALPPSPVGLGFNLMGGGAIVRDTRGKRDVLTLDGSSYHRFILSFPSGSFELKYNDQEKIWTSSPHGFLKINHPEPNLKKPKSIVGGLDFTSVIDGDAWEITTKDGTTYVFGAAELEKRLEPNGKIKALSNLNDGDNKITEIEVNGKKRLKNGYLTNEFDLVELCTGPSHNPCQTREGTVPPSLLVTKWLLREIINPLGQKITFYYQTNQSENANLYSTPVTYLSEIQWNDGKHRVVYQREERPDKGPSDEILERIKEVRVETKVESDNTYHLVRRYNLGYETGDLPNIPAKGFPHSHLASILEFGREGTNDVAKPVTFRYESVGVPSANSMYLKTIFNGFGGDTTFAYDWFAVPYKNKENQSDNTASGRWGSHRARVNAKTVQDSLENKSYTERYRYANPRGFAETLGDSSKESTLDCRGCFPPTGLNFLGHESVDIEKTDFDGSPLAHERIEFYQANEETSCFQVHPANGSAREVSGFNGSTIAKRTTSIYRFRLDNRNDQDPNQCDKDLVSQPVFVYLTRSDQYVEEPNNLTTYYPLAKSRLRTAVEYQDYDAYGNLKQTKNLGEVDFASGAEIQPDDVRYSYTTFTVNDRKWILGLPAMSYKSFSDQCHSDQRECQWGRTELYYDGQGNFTDAPDRGLLTEKRVFTDENKVYKETYVYDDFGNQTKQYLPKPNQDQANEMGLAEEKTFDGYYHTLVEKKTNSRGFSSEYGDYDVLLQLPRKLRKKISANPPGYRLEKIEYDGFGRLRKLFANDPTDYDTVLSIATTIQDYVDGNGLAVRRLTLVSLPDQRQGNPEYESVDSFYDSLGKLVQVQELSTTVEGVKQQLIKSTSFDALGRVNKVYDTLTTSSVLVDPGTSQNPPPAYFTPSGGMLAQTAYDQVGRVTQELRHDSATGQTYTTSHIYAANAVQTINPTGLEKTSIVDSWGRVTMVSVKGGDGTLVKKNLYAKSFIDKPITEEYFGQGNDSEKAIVASDFYSNGWLKSLQDPSLGRIEFSYDINGNKKEEKHYVGSEPMFNTTYYYDDLGRLQKKQSSTELFKKPGNTIEYHYDDGANALGLLTSVSDPTGKTSYVYDKGQRIEKVIKQVFDKTRETTSEHNKISQKIKNQIVNDVLSFGYDEENRIQTISLNGQPLKTQSRYDRLGKMSLVGFSLGSNVFEQRTNYDGLGRLQSIAFKNASNGRALFGQSYGYNSRGELANIDDQVGNKSLTFGYDAFSQLKSASGFYQTNYDYDIFGRIKGKKEDKQTKFSYTNAFPFFAPDEVIQKSDNEEKQIKLQYDAKTGGLSEDQENCYSYNQERQLIELRTKQNSAETCGQATTGKVLRFYYDYEGSLVFSEEYQNEQLVKKTYIFGALEEIYEGESKAPADVRLTIPLSPYVTAVKNGDKLSLVVRDHLESTRVITGVDDTSLTFDYYPYGTLVSSSPASGVPTDKLFTSQRKIEDLNLYNYGTRFYNPSFGLFLQPDKVQGPNRFAYAANTPAMANDPSGNAYSLGEMTDGSSILTYTTSSTLYSPTISYTEPIRPLDIPEGWFLGPAAVIGAAAVGSAAIELGPALLMPAVHTTIDACSWGWQYCVGYLGNLAYSQLAPMGSPTVPRANHFISTAQVAEEVVDDALAFERQVAAARAALIPPRAAAIEEDLARGINPYILPPGTRVASLDELQTSEGLIRSFGNTSKLSNENLLFVQTRSGTILVSTRHNQKSPHSAVAGGQSVVASGHIQFSRGKVLEVSNDSGHYWPADWRLGSVWEELSRLKIPLKASLDRGAASRPHGLSPLK